ncbi:hypothetical protein D9615_005687 [Tricholomella constricta]|uniref:Uncharacterized protein n=1 Tax=Tricholomella constricta TaxID=117010 RepID=A0A8H5HB40_9AGAR|nr:hypothetical protein D9615_005687 [Tricholomella constricta]
MPQNPVKVKKTQKMLKNQVQMTTEEVDFVWDSWRSHPGVVSPSPYNISSSSNSSLASSSYENSIRPLPSKVSTKAGNSVAKRWGLFGLKKTVDDNPPATPTSAINDDARRSVTQKKSKLFKKKTEKTKSTPNLKGVALGPTELGKVNAYHSPSPDLHPPHVPIPKTPYTVITPILTEGMPLAPVTVDSAVYFTVDPAWDKSKGDTADLYLLPFPGAGVHAWHPALDRPEETPRKRAMTQFSNVPHKTGYVKNTDNETSFLFLE